MTTNIEIREVKPGEYTRLGELMVEIYSNLDGFPGPLEQPDYYRMLTSIGSLSEEKEFKVLVAQTATKELAGGIVYCGDMSQYGSGGTATMERDASGIRLLCVDPQFRGMGIGRALTNACIELARGRGHKQVILHTTQAMQLAWGLYLRMGFVRSPELDFSNQALRVFGFRLLLDHD